MLTTKVSLSGTIMGQLEAPAPVSVCPTRKATSEAWDSLVAAVGFSFKAGDPGRNRKLELGLPSSGPVLFELQSVTAVTLHQIPMVNIVNYGALDALPIVNKRKSVAYLAGVAVLALVAVAAVLNLNGADKTSELFEYAHVGAHSDDYSGTVEPATLNDDQARLPLLFHCMIRFF